MLSGNPFLLILGFISIIIFFNLLKTRSSKKQIQRDNRANYSWYWSNNIKKKKEENIIDGVAKEIKDDKD
jgi:hypothetical protein